MTYWFLHYWPFLFLGLWVGFILALTWWVDRGCDRVLIWWDRRKWKAGR